MGAKGFSLKTRGETHTKETSLLWGLPAGAYDFPEPFIDLYVSPKYYTETEAKDLRTKYKTAGPVDERGQTTLHLYINEETEQAARRMVEAVWNLEQDLRR